MFVLFYIIIFYTFHLMFKGWLHKLPMKLNITSILMYRDYNL